MGLQWSPGITDPPPPMSPTLPCNPFPPPFSYFTRCTDTKNLLIIWGTSLSLSHSLLLGLLLSLSCAVSRMWAWLQRLRPLHIIIIIRFIFSVDFVWKRWGTFGQLRLRFVSFLFAFCTFVNFNAVILFLFRLCCCFCFSFMFCFRSKRSRWLSFHFFQFQFPFLLLPMRCSAYPSPLSTLPPSLDSFPFSLLFPPLLLNSSAW